MNLRKGNTTVEHKKSITFLNTLTTKAVTGVKFISKHYREYNGKPSFTQAKLFADSYLL